MKPSLTRFVVLFTVTLTLLGATTWAQEPEVTGVVQDGSAAVIPGAKVTLTEDLTQDGRESTTDNLGRFSFSGVSPGEYIVTVEARGFQVAQRRVEISAHPLPALTIVVKPAIEARITVTARPPQDPTAASRNADALDFDEDLLRGLPLPTESQSLVTFISDFLSPAAQGTDEASVVIDGMETSTFQLSMPLFAIQHVRVNHNPYAAEFRRPGKARIEVTTRRPRKRFHGGLRYTALASPLNATDPLSPAKADDNRNLVEGMFTGPLYRDRVSFFISAQHFAERKSAEVNAITPAGQVRERVPLPGRETNLLGRSDFRLSNAHLLSARYDFVDQRLENRGVGGLRLPAQARDQHRKVNRLQMVERATTSAWVNEIRFNYERQDFTEGKRATAPQLEVKGAFVDGPEQVFRDSATDTFEFQNVTSYLRGRHAVRFGGRLRTRQVESLDESNFAGTFLFADLVRFAQRRPFVFRSVIGNPSLELSYREADGFFQDEIKVGQRFNLMLGARYDWQSEIEDINNLAPRLAFAWAPGRASKTVVRGGLGLFFERLPQKVSERRLLFDGSRLREIVIPNPGFPNPFSADVQRPAPSITRTAANLETPYLMQASLSVEQELTREHRLTFEYAFLHGVHLFRARNVNALQPATRRRADARFHDIIEVQSDAFLRSHALGITYRGRWRKFFKGTVQYVLSRTVNNTREAEPGAGNPFARPADNFDLAPEIGRADFDRRHRLNVAAVLDFPRGFSMGSLLVLGSGVPFDVTTGGDENGDGEANDRPPGVTRNTGNGPGLARFDVRVSKRFNVPGPFAARDRKPAALEISMDAINALNHANFNNFVGVVTSGFFGRPVSAKDSRRIQLSARYTF